MLLQNLQGFLKKSEMLRAEYLVAGTKPYVSAPFLREACRQMIIVRFQDHWAYFVRQLIILSASGRAHTTSGNSVASAHGFSSVGGVEAWLAMQNRGNREPDWHVTRTSTKIARQLKISNFDHVSSALGSVTSPEEKIRTYRNFIVHRNKSTANKLKQMVQNNGWRPNDVALLPQVYVTGGRHLWEAWFDDLQAVARVASA